MGHWTPGISLIALLVCTVFASADFDSAARDYRAYRFTAAFQEFRKLAEAGDARAQTVLALMYKSGEGVPPDNNAAFQWYERAAAQGYAPAQYQAGVMLAGGMGTEMDREAAITVLQQAARAGYHKANSLLDQLNAELVYIEGVEEITPWSKQWDLHLPQDLKMALPTIETVPVPTFRAQLGAMGSQDAALSLWKLVSEPNPDLFNGLSLTIRESGDAQAIYRVQAGPFDDMNDAERFCRRLAQRSELGCLPLQSR